MREAVLREKEDEQMHFEPGLYPSIIDIVVAMKDKVRKRLGAQKIEYNGIYVLMDKIAQKSHSFT